MTLGQIRFIRELGPDADVTCFSTGSIGGYRNIRTGIDPVPACRNWSNDENLYHQNGRARPCLFGLGAGARLLASTPMRRAPASKVRIPRQASSIATICSPAYRSLQNAIRKSPARTARSLPITTRRHHRYRFAHPPRHLHLHLAASGADDRTVAGSRPVRSFADSAAVRIRRPASRSMRRSRASCWRTARGRRRSIFAASVPTVRCCSSTVAASRPPVSKARRPTLRSTCCQAALIERYDLLLDGASSIYGSDAVAGVGNIVLRKDFDGLELFARGEINPQGAGEDYTISAAYGINTDRAFIGIGAEYDYRDDNPLQGPRFLQRLRHATTKWTRTAIS